MTGAKRARDRPGELRGALVDALVDIPALTAVADRRLLVNLIRRDVKGFPDVPERNETRLHVLEIVLACMSSPGGLAALKLAVTVMAPEAPAVKEVTRLVDSARPASFMDEQEARRVASLVERAEAQFHNPEQWHQILVDSGLVVPDGVSLPNTFKAFADQPHGLGLSSALTMIGLLAVYLPAPLSIELADWAEHHAGLVGVLEEYLANFPRGTLPRPLPDAHQSGQERNESELRRRSGRQLTAGYRSDDLDDVDQLGVSDDVRTLAALLCSSQVRPPLSVGLFGDWGAGKSFFMRALQNRIALLAASAQQASAESFFCARVAQISFNAWHYADANLWASLVTRVFEGLQQHLRDARTSDEEVRNLLAALETSRTLLSDAERERDDALAALRRAEQDRADQQAASDEQTVAELVEAHPQLSRSADELSAALGIDRAATDFFEIVDISRDLRRTAGRVRRRWHALGRDRSGWTRRRLVTVLGGALALAVVALGVLFWTGQPVVAVLTSVLVVGAGLLTTVKILLGRTREALAAVEELLAAQATEEEAKLARSERAVEAARERVARYEAEVERLRAAEPTGLRQFIEERYTSSEYEGHLGVVALIQRDFRALSNLLTAPAEGPPVPRLDRIVLYIDDLDRCPPDRVIQVLQAVHLLLAFPLFVVVVGVDSRWLIRSLEHQYPATIGTSSDAVPTMPHHYLEKIFQIPYWLPPMRRAGFSRLVRDLAGGSTPLAATEASEKSETAATEEADGPSAEPVPPVWPEAAAALGDLAPSAMLINNREIAMMESLADWIPTPRAAKRLVNLYRLIKVQACEYDAEAFEGAGEQSGDFAAVLTLLAIMIGAPDAAGRLFRAIRATSAPTWTAFMSETEQFGDDIGPRLDNLTKLLGDASMAPFKSWESRVARHSFVLSRALQ